MQFKVKDTDVKISFTFLAAYLIFISFSNGKIFIYSLIFSLLHEIIHILFIYAFKGRISSICFNASGGNITRDSTIILSNAKEAVISISAPLFNLLLGAFFLLFLKKEIMGYINLILGFFNILPFFSFDGGRFLYYLLQKRINHKSLQAFLTVTSLFVTITISTLSCYIFFNIKKNLLIIFLSVLMLFSLIINTFKEFSN